MDFTEILKAGIAGMPLAGLVVLIVEYVKSFKDKDGNQRVTGNGLLVWSGGTGLVLGVIYSMIVLRPPVDGDWYVHFIYWTGAVAYGIGLGGLASVAYETLKGIYEKSIQKLLEKGINKSDQG